MSAIRNWIQCRNQIARGVSWFRFLSFLDDRTNACFGMVYRFCILINLKILVIYTHQTFWIFTSFSNLEFGFVVWKSFRLRTLFYNVGTQILFLFYKCKSWFWWYFEKFNFLIVIYVVIYEFFIWFNHKRSTKILIKLIFLGFISFLRLFSFRLFWKFGLCRTKCVLINPTFIFWKSVTSRWFIGT